MKEILLLTVFILGGCVIDDGRGAKTTDKEACVESCTGPGGPSGGAGMTACVRSCDNPNSEQEGF